MFKLMNKKITTLLFLDLSLSEPMSSGRILVPHTSDNRFLDAHRQFPKNVSCSPQQTAICVNPRCQMIPDLKVIKDRFYDFD